MFLESDQEHRLRSTKSNKMSEDEAPDQRYHCANCGKDITLRLKCAECPDCDLCLDCFSRGAEVGGHSRHHDYQVIDDGSFSLLTDDWGAIEEVLLLDAVEQEGLGNWEGVAGHVTTKTAREIKEYYEQMYIGSVIGEGAILADHHQQHLTDTGGGMSPLPLDASPVPMDQAEQLDMGYLPKRDDFEQEYDNHAEHLICGLSFTRGDEELMRALKLCHVDMLNDRLRERQQRKRLSKEHGLLGTKAKHQHRKKYSKEERDLRSKFKTFSRLLSPNDFEDLVTSLQRERDLRCSVQEVQGYREDGVPRKDEKQDGHKGHIHGDCESILSGAERRLCETVEITAQEYLEIKAAVLKDMATRQMGYPARPSLPRQLREEQRRELTSHFVQIGLMLA